MKIISLIKGRYQGKEENKPTPKASNQDGVLSYDKKIFPFMDSKH